MKVKDDIKFLCYTLLTFFLVKTIKNIFNMKRVNEYLIINESYTVTQ